MAHVQFEGNDYTLNEGESVLACLLRHGVNYPHSCKTGTCQSCLSRANPDEINPAWQVGLKPTLSAQGYFLPCLATPKHNMTVKLPKAEEVAVEAVIHELFYFNHNVICLRLKIADLTPWVPGQYLNLVNPEGVVRSYSIANQPVEEGYIELHVKCLPEGQMGAWLTHVATPGMKVSLRGPMGDCFYSNPNCDVFPIVLVGTGTGLAPLLGIAQMALSQQHAGQIVLIHGGINDSDLYQDEKLLAMAQEHPNFIYEKCTLEKSTSCQQSDIETLLDTVLKTLEKPRLYVCGPEVTTKKLKVKAFLAGVASSAIYSDAFVMSH